MFNIIFRITRFEYIVTLFFQHCKHIHTLDIIWFIHVQNDIENTIFEYILI